MQILKDLMICDKGVGGIGADNAVIYDNTRGDILSINLNIPASEESGGGVAVVVQGTNRTISKNDPNYDSETESEWNNICAIKIASYNITTIAKERGLYEYGVEGVRKIRIYVDPDQSSIDPTDNPEVTIHAFVACSSD